VVPGHGIRLVLLGKELDAFESAFAVYCGTSTALVSKWLDALHLILRAMEIGPGDRGACPLQHLSSPRGGGVVRGSPFPCRCEPGAGDLQHGAGAHPGRRHAPHAGR